jgi:hypothetical protein
MNWNESQLWAEIGMSLNNITKAKRRVSVNNWTNKTKQLGQQRA